MPRTLIIILLFVVCAIAAATGGYVALRQSSPVAVSAVPPATRGTADTVQTQQGVGGQPAAGTVGVSAGDAPAQAAEVVEAAIPAPPIASGSSNTAPVRTTVPAQVKPISPASSPGARPAQAAPMPSRTSAAPSEPVAAGAIGAPVSAEPPALSPQLTQASPPPDPPPPLPTFEEVVVPAESVLGLQVMTTTTTEEAKVEDPVEATVTRDVRIGGTIAIPAGTRVLGVVTMAERGGKVKGRARLGVRFHMLVLADRAATRVPIRTDTIFRESESQGQQSAAKIGAATAGGAILGAIFGGGKGALIGGTVGAGGGTASVMHGDRTIATLQAGTAVTVRLQDAVTVTVER